MPDPQPTTYFSDVVDIASVKTDGKLPLVVGGHAINIWVLAFSHRLGHQLRAYAPFTTKDLDLWGPKKILDTLAAKYNSPITLSPPRSPGIGYVIIPRPNFQFKVELLTSVRGIRRIEEQNCILINILGTPVRVLDAISCLKAKIANAADLNQTDRQDVKHVQIMKLCAKEFVSDLIVQGNRGQISERLVLNYVEDLQETISNAKAITTSNKWGISFDEVMPMQVLRQSTMVKIQNYVRYQLDAKQAKIDFNPRQNPGGPKLSM